MGDRTGIQWTDHSWNPWQGCEHVSPGCDNCYMFRDMRRYGKNPERVVRSSPATFNKPLRWNREAEAAGVRRRVFLASWSDFFIKEADEWRDEAWAIVKACTSLDFQILTKRHGRIATHLPRDWGRGYPNAWLGVSAEDGVWWARRVPVLAAIPAAIHFVSYEPALGPLGFDVSALGIDWVIIGGESAPARPFELEWAREVLAICRRDGAAPFVKQLGSEPRVPVPTGLVKLRLKDSHGGEMDEWPEDLRVRQFPEVRS